ncbi:uncharacterized protein LOC135057236 [Pseudophryne corroboree]|uniref:uncharacterized protein LOC135057236 n=1 Tax=Pseudophryne corroboree TaxID=495146 RepID=UPI00308136C6
MRVHRISANGKGNKIELVIELAWHCPLERKETEEPEVELTPYGSSNPASSIVLVSSASLLPNLVEDYGESLTWNSWTFLLLLSLSSVIYSQSCKLLHRHHDHVTKQILQKFNQTIGANESPGECLSNTIILPNIDHLYQISQVESAAIAVCEVYNQTVQFYKKHHEKLGCHQSACDRLQVLLNHQGHQLADCIPATAENHLFIEGISKQFNSLEKIILDQDNTECARRIVQTEIGRNLQLAAQLSSRMRRQQLMKTLL